MPYWSVLGKLQNYGSTHAAGCGRVKGGRNERGNPAQWMNGTVNKPARQQTCQPAYSASQSIYLRILTSNNDQHYQLCMIISMYWDPETILRYCYFTGTLLSVSLCRCVPLCVIAMCHCHCYWVGPTVVPCHIRFLISVCCMPSASLLIGVGR